MTYYIYKKYNLVSGYKPTEKKYGSKPIRYIDRYSFVVYDNYSITPDGKFVLTGNEVSVGYHGGLKGYIVRETEPDMSLNLNGAMYDGNYSNKPNVYGNWNWLVKVYVNGDYFNIDAFFIEKYNEIGTFINNVTAIEGTYPDNGAHVDGYWYIKDRVANRIIYKGKECHLPIGKKLMYKGVEFI